MPDNEETRVTFRMPTDLAKKAKTAAKKNRVSLNTYLTAATMFAVDHGLQFFHDVNTPTDG